MDELTHLRLRVAELEARLAGDNGGQQPAAPPIAADLSVGEILGTLIDMIPVGLVICDAAGRFALVNTLAKIMLGAEPRGTVFDPQPGFTLHRPDGSPFPREELPLAQAVRTGRIVHDTEVLIRRRDGSQAVLLVVAVPTIDAAGHLSGAIASYQDITERKQFEEQLRNSEARLRAILNTAVDAIITIDERGIIESVNRAVTRIFGYEESELIGHSVNILMPSPYREHHDEYMENYRRTGRAKIIGIGREVVGQRKDGTVFPIDLAVSEVWLAEKRVFTGIIRDITARKQTEEALRALNDTLEQRVLERTAELFAANEALRESEERFRQIAEAIPQVIWIGLPDLSRTLYINPAYEKVWGRSVESFYRNPSSAAEALHPDDRDRVMRRFLEAFNTGGAAPDDLEDQFRVIWPDGQQRIVTARAFPIRDAEGRVYRVSAIFEDVTEHLRLEREVLEASEAERRRIGQDLHDTLGQVLTGASFLTRVLEQTLQARGAPEARDAAEIAGQITHAIDMTRSLARGLVPVEMNADGLMNGLRDLADKASQGMGIDCRFHADAPVQVHDSTTATHLYRIAQEALNNAVKHGQASRVDIRLAVDGEQVTLTIEDDGLGLPEHVDPERGMGLRIMEYRARMVGGTLDVRRRDGRGTAVACTFRQLSSRSSG